MRRASHKRVAAASVRCTSGDGMNLLAAITFHFVEARLGYLTRCIEGLAGAGVGLDVIVYTQVTDAERLQRIRDCFSGVHAAVRKVEVRSEPSLWHPYLLAWSHKQALHQDFLQTDAYTHFLYTEDDLLFGAKNLRYWAESRELLRAHGLIPAFFRVEQDANGRWVSTDQVNRLNVAKLARVEPQASRWFLNLTNPYQATYLFDRELAQEHVETLDQSPGAWGIREMAAAGQTFVRVPRGYRSRCVVPYDVAEQEIPQACWIHHLPNNYALNPRSGFGKLPMHGPGLFESS